MAETHIETHTEEPLDKLKITNLKEEAELIQSVEEDLEARERRIYEKRKAQAAYAREMRKRKREQEAEKITNEVVEEELEVPDAKKIHPNPDTEQDKEAIKYLKDELEQLKQSLQTKSEELEEVRLLRKELKHAVKPAQPASYWRSMPQYSSW